MESRRTPQSRGKRPSQDLDDERLRKRLSPSTKINDEDCSGPKIFEFRILLPNGSTVDLKIYGTGDERPLEKFLGSVKQKYFSSKRLSGSTKQKRAINWNNQDLHFVDIYENEIRGKINLNSFNPNECHILRLKDGSDEADTYENMWDLTPDTDLLKELPEQYTFQAALADLIDNSLQAVWYNKANDRRLISVEIDERRIEIFDTGPGMDGSHENSIVKWGKMGASLHRLARECTTGVKPPYLMPYFGMFGYGGPIASMHLGRRALVSSKTKQSKKVYMLNLEREALLNSSPQQTWRTNGGLRDPSLGERERAPHGSFTKVEVFEPKIRGTNIQQIQCGLKDIYFPYIQCDEASNMGRTSMPIEFQVNGTNLAEIGSGEIAITNLLSCNGPEFTFQLKFTRDAISACSLGSSAYPEANARLRCVYFPTIQGKESIDVILEKLEADGCGIMEDYKSFSRVSVRRLGRLLPDARWAWLPFIEPKPRKGDRGLILKKCYFRVKCFIDTDSGFNPTTVKTDLEHHHPYTVALKNFGKPLEKEKGVHIKVVKDGKEINLSQLEKQYEEWIFQMHDHYDKEIDSGEDEPTFVLHPSNKKELGISSDVLRVHKLFWRKGALWKSGQRIKVIKGACPRYHKNNVFATLEYIILEGCEGDTGGEARLICRPISVPDDSGCILDVNNGTTSIQIRRSISLPISVIDSEKFVTVEDSVWKCQLEKHSLKIPSCIDVLSGKDCQDLGIERGLPVDVIHAGCDPPKEIVAVIRPACFNSASVSNNLDPKYIVQENLEMTLEVLFKAENENVENVKKIFYGETTPTSRSGHHGLYVFSIGRDLPKLFQEAGIFTFMFSLKDLNCQNFEKRVQVTPSSEVGSWQLLDDTQIQKFRARVGSCFPPFDIVCRDKYNNRIPFPCDTKVMIKLNSCKGLTAQVTNTKQCMSPDNRTLTIKDVRVKCSELDKIRPSYEATLLTFSADGLFSVFVPCEVMPGAPTHASARGPNSGKELLPGQIIKDIVLEIFDAFGNHVKANESINIEVDGFHIQGRGDSVFKVDHSGCVDLSGFLKVVKGYGERVSFSVLSTGHMIFMEEFQIQRRELRPAFEVPLVCAAGNVLENLVFEVINTEGEVDRSIHNDDKNGQHHSLMISSDSLDIDCSLRYSFHFGRCTIRTILLPQKEGIFRFEVTHSVHPELHFNVLVKHVLNLEHANVPFQNSGGKNLILHHSSGLEDSKLESSDTHESSDERNLSLLESFMPSEVRDLVKCIMNDQEELEDDFCRYGLHIKGLETKLELLNLQQSKLEQEISDLRAGLNLDHINDLECTTEKGSVLEQIACKDDSAAAVISKLFQSPLFKEQSKSLADRILGVVACLGTVQTNELSRIFAQYLGEDQMLAVVCKSQEDASELVKYESNGKINSTRGLLAAGAELGMSVNKQYLIICLENIRPYTGGLASDPQRKLTLQGPTLPNGEPPPGYLGYAVNMIDLDVRYWSWRTDCGHGLRETLFYRLFGELQVYANRHYMNLASSYIKDGAVSIDGGIVRGNGVISVGCWEPDIKFPVVPLESQRHFYPRTVETLNLIEDKKQELRLLSDKLRTEKKTYSKVMRKFRKKEARYRKFLDNKGPVLQGLARKFKMDNLA